jgi:CubicO group peptidase (beta-lactamase class C family)
MLSRIYGLFLALSLFTGSCKAQDQGRTQDPAKFVALDSWMEDNAPTIGGRAILLIYKDGKPVYSKSVNEMSRKQKMVNKFVARKMKKEANTDDYTASTRQPIASCSKWLSAALVMTFVDEGRLQLTDTVGKYLPVLSQHGKGMITISQCLSHLTAIREPDLKESLKKITRMTTMDEAIAWLADLPMEGQPGKVFHYSNVGLQIAAAVLEKISGESFQTLFAERIARPLDMKNTDFGQTRVALPAGGASSTPEDYMNFLWMIQQRGVFHGHRILSENSVAEMQVNRVTPEVRIAYTPVKGGDKAAGQPGMGWVGYGFGEWIFLEPDTHEPSGSVSSPGLFGSIPWVDNKRGYCAFLMTFYLSNKGREERLRELKKTVDEAIK